MKITFVTTMSVQGSTVIGRVMPLAKELAKKHQAHILVHHFSSPGACPPYWREGEVSEPSEDGGVVVEAVGRDPFSKTPAGKKRLSGFRLIARLKFNAFKAALKLISLKPDVIIIVKPLPENVFAVRLATLCFKPKKVILDVDDFELTANVLTSLLQRAAVHWAERAGARIADHIVTASPFLSDHFEQLTHGKKQITMIPTGV